MSGAIEAPAERTIEALRILVAGGLRRNERWADAALSALVAATDALAIGDDAAARLGFAELGRALERAPLLPDPIFDEWSDDDLRRMIVDYSATGAKIVGQIRRLHAVIRVGGVKSLRASLDLRCKTEHLLLCRQRVRDYAGELAARTRP